MVLRLAVDLGLFDAIAQQGGTATTAQLAEATGGDELLVCTFNVPKNIA